MEDSKNSKSRSGELRSIEIEGRTPAEAIEKALSILKATRDTVKVKILTEEERGLFGMEGARPAKVKVTLLRKKRALKNSYPAG